MQSTTTNFSSITTFIFDVDGVLTDGTILLLENGLQARRMNIKDGYALQLAVKKGYRIWIVSGAVSVQVASRLYKLGITEVHLGISDKKKLVEELCATQQINVSETLFMGDDMPDYEVMRFTGLAACPADAVDEIKEAAQYISPLNGGTGCVRDIIEKVLKARGHWRHEEDIASR